MFCVFEFVDRRSGAWNLLCVLCCMRFMCDVLVVLCFWLWEVWVVRMGEDEPKGS